VLAFLLYCLRGGLFRLLVRAGLDDRDLEIAVLRHQRRVLTRRGKRPRYGITDRAFLAAVSRFLPQERWSAFPVVPDTLKRWRRQLESNKGLRGRCGPGRPQIDPALAELILRLGRENPRWGYLRIKGELISSGSESPPRPSRTCCAAAAWGRRLGGSDPRGESSCGPKPSPSFPPAPPPPTNRIGLGTSRPLGPRPRRQQADFRSSKSAAATGLLPLRIPSVIIRSPLGKSPPSPGRMGPFGSRVARRPPPSGGRPRDGPSPLTFRLVGVLDHGKSAGRARVSRTIARRVGYKNAIGRVGGRNAVGL
jgi:hypothetical protein